MIPTRPLARTVLLTALAMTAFAGNSLPCRIALKHTSLDAASFRRAFEAAATGLA